MNDAIRTYGIVINMDYEHHDYAICKELWNEISREMLLQSFYLDKRMFILTTELGKEEVCNKARKILEDMESDKESYEKQVFNYIKDFYALDVTDYVDLTRPQASSGIEVEEDIGD
ncbi:MAG: hypothetical protein QNL62_22355 [Gammaproteobacteria bacterium]|nr:hypothetical protein [Gammaproteobacteria bacterium]